MKGNTPKGRQERGPLSRAMADPNASGSKLSRADARQHVDIEMPDQPSATTRYAEQHDTHMSETPMSDMALTAAVHASQDRGPDQSMSPGNTRPTGSAEVEHERIDPHVLQSRLQTCERQCRALRDDNAQAMQERDTAREQFATCEAALMLHKNSMETERKERGRQIHELSKQNRDLQQRITFNDQERARLAEQLESVTKEFQNRKKESSMLRETIQQQSAYIETSVTKAQNAAVRLLSDTVSNSLPDDQIRRCFESLFDELHEWSRTNSNKDPGVIKTVPFRKKLDNSGLVHRLDPDDPNTALEFDLEDSTATDTLLNADLSIEICERFLGTPFFVAEQIQTIGSQASPVDHHDSTDRALERLLRRLKKDAGDRISIAHTWRASTVRVLAETARLQGRLDRMFDTHAAEILLEAGPLLDSRLSKRERSDFAELVQKFGNLALQLWSQNHEPKYVLPRMLKGMQFKHSSPDMEAARVVGLEKGDRSLDGRPIMVVLQPLIQGFGDQNGHDYDKHRIWSKAVVWVSNRS
ncbi:uncharacterized protein AB675_251 [Cyphellophora attinorum]|uniref:Uncharacterized protein n=1 Tax=Cyphellophora attinorum TaxID=1664694 RepID=A0A0N1HY89_9EURO|nr:uncharacterized protein AB675_251 [Phialophora attinorum]KPI45756.1 hypothetical protein AB675_251 [Phialophora attinorum]